MLKQIRRHDEQESRTIPFGRKQAPVPLHEIPHPQNPAGLLQLRRVYSRRRRTYRVADQSGVPRPEHVEPAVIHTRQLDARGAGPARTRRFVRLHPDDVQRGGTGRLHVRQDRQGAPSADSRGAAHLLLERHLPPHRGAGPFGTRLHLRLARQHRPDHGDHQAGRGQDERRGGYRRGRRAGHSAGRGLDPLLLDLPARTLQTDPAAEHRIPEGRPQRTAADPAQTRTPQDPARHQLRGGRGALRPLQEEHAGRDFRRGVRTPPQRPARKREARRRHRPLPPHQGGQPADARTAAVVRPNSRRRPAGWEPDSSPRIRKRCSRSCTNISPRSSHSATSSSRTPIREPSSAAPRIWRRCRR